MARVGVRSRLCAAEFKKHIIALRTAQPKATLSERAEACRAQAMFHCCRFICFDRTPEEGKLQPCALLNVRLNVGDEPTSRLETLRHVEEEIIQNLIRKMKQDTEGPDKVEPAIAKFPLPKVVGAYQPWILITES